MSTGSPRGHILLLRQQGGESLKNTHARTHTLIQTHTHTHTHSHTHTHTHTHIHTLHGHTCTAAKGYNFKCIAHTNEWRNAAHARTHTNTHTHAHPINISNRWMVKPFLPHTHTHTLAHTHSRTTYIYHRER